MMEFAEAQEWREKAECLVDWRREARTSILCKFCDTEYYLFDKCEEELINYYTEDYTEEDEEWYKSCIVKIDDEYWKRIRAN